MHQPKKTVKLKDGTEVSMFKPSLSQLSKLSRLMMGCSGLQKGNKTYKEYAEQLLSSTTNSTTEQFIMEELPYFILINKNAFEICESLIKECYPFLENIENLQPNIFMELLINVIVSANEQ